MQMLQMSYCQKKNYQNDWYPFRLNHLYFIKWIAKYHSSVHKWVPYCDLLLTKLSTGFVRGLMSPTVTFITHNTLTITRVPMFSHCVCIFQGPVVPKNLVDHVFLFWHDKQTLQQHAFTLISIWWPGGYYFASTLHRIYKTHCLYCHNNDFNQIVYIPNYSKELCIKFSTWLRSMS